MKSELKEGSFPCTLVRLTDTADIAIAIQKYSNYKNITFSSLFSVEALMWKAEIIRESLLLLSESQIFFLCCSQLSYRIFISCMIRGWDTALAHLPTGKGKEKWQKCSTSKSQDPKTHDTSTRSLWASLIRDSYLTADETTEWILCGQPWESLGTMVTGKLDFGEHLQVPPANIENVDGRRILPKSFALLYVE